MKISNAILALFALVLISCGSDDDQSPFIPVVVSPNITVDADAIIALPPGSDITDLVNFGQDPGQSTSEYTSEVALNNRFKLDQPQGLLPTDKLLYQRLDFFDEGGSPLSNDLIDMYLQISINPNELLYEDPTNPGTDLTTIWQYNVIMADLDLDTTFKYDIQCFIMRDDSFYGPFTIDPKIRIRSRR